MISQGMGTANMTRAILRGAGMAAFRLTAAQLSKVGPRHNIYIYIYVIMYKIIYISYRGAGIAAFRLTAAQLSKVGPRCVCVCVRVRVCACVCVCVCVAWRRASSSARSSSSRRSDAAAAVTSACSSATCLRAPRRLSDHAMVSRHARRPVAYRRPVSTRIHDASSHGMEGL